MNSSGQSLNRDLGDQPSLTRWMARGGNWVRVIPIAILSLNELSVVGKRDLPNIDGVVRPAQRHLGEPLGLPPVPSEKDAVFLWGNPPGTSRHARRPAM